MDENNAERVFDFIVAEDVVVHFRKTSPAIAAVEDQSGTWNHAGASRIVVMDNGNRFRETIIAYQRPYLFHYMLTEFSGAPQKGVVNEAIAMFIVQPYGPRAHVNFHYAMRPESEHGSLIRALSCRTSGGRGSRVSWTPSRRRWTKIHGPPRTAS